MFSNGLGHVSNDVMLRADRGHFDQRQPVLVARVLPVPDRLVGDGKRGCAGDPALTSIDTVTPEPSVEFTLNPGLLCSMRSGVRVRPLWIGDSDLRIYP